MFTSYNICSVYTSAVKMSTLANENISFVVKFVHMLLCNNQTEKINTLRMIMYRQKERCNKNDNNNNNNNNNSMLFYL